MTRILRIREKSPKSTIGELILEKLLPDTCKFHLAALHQFHFAAQQAPPISNCDSTTNEERIPKCFCRQSTSSTPGSATALPCGNFRTSTTANWPISALTVQTSRGSPGSTRMLDASGLNVPNQRPPRAGDGFLWARSGRRLHAFGLDDRPRMRPG